MEDVSLNEDDILVSFDVQSLFTSIPVEEAIKICEQRLKEDNPLLDRTITDVDTIICLLHFCVTKTAFQYDNKHYRQKEGVAMRSLVSSAVADIFMQDLEMRAFAQFLNQPRLWKRFVDNILSIVRRAERERGSP